MVHLGLVESLTGNMMGLRFLYAHTDSASPGDCKSNKESTHERILLLRNGGCDAADYLLDVCRRAMVPHLPRPEEGAPLHHQKHSPHDRYDTKAHILPPRAYCNTLRPAIVLMPAWDRQQD